MARVGGSFGVALGGGSARGLAHVGALKVLEARGRDPDMLAGTSFGAIVAALFALGASALEIEHQVRQLDVGELWRQALDPAWSAAGLIRGRRLEAWLDRKYFCGASFSDLERPLAVACTDLAARELVVLREGSVARAVVASCALPGFFAPVRMGDRMLIDGGFMESVPFTALRTLGAQRLLGIHAGIEVTGSPAIERIRRTARGPLARSWHASAGRGVALPALRALRHGLALAATSYERGVVAPEGAALVRILPPVAWWDFHRSPEAIAAGERAMCEALDLPEVERLAVGA